MGAALCSTETASPFLGMSITSSSERIDLSVTDHPGDGKIVGPQRAAQNGPENLAQRPAHRLGANSTRSVERRPGSGRSPVPEDRS